MRDFDVKLLYPFLEYMRLTIIMKMLE